jgi:glycerol-3-phosphate acyltransferase PlsY
VLQFLPIGGVVMQVLMDVGVVLLAYILGAIPFGLLIVKVTTGKDIRQVASGRTGGTNAMRAAGCWAGVATALFDMFKGVAAVWLARILAPNVWIEVLAPTAAVLGHNYSVFLIERSSQGTIRLRGGAGGAPAAGGAIGLLWPMWWLILLGFPIPLLMFFGVGYASITTLSISLTATVIFALLYFLGYSTHWQYIIYGVLTFFILLWALRPNIKALMEGNERFHGWRPWKKKEATAKKSG